MVNIKTQIKNNWRNIFLLSILFVIILLTQFIVREVVVFRSNLNSFENELYEVEKSRIKNDVDNRVLEINSIYATVEEDMRTHIKDNLSGLIFAIEVLMNEMSESTLTEKKDAIIRTTQEYNTNDPDHTYFINTIDGYHILSGISNEEVYEYTFNDKDILNRYYVQDMINGVLGSETGDTYVTYYYPKEPSGEPFQKTSYLKLIEEVGYYIGSGGYQVDYDESVQEGLVQLFTEYYEDGIEYVYVLTGSGEIIYHKSNEYIGETRESISDPIWTIALDSIYDFIDTSNEGFITYTFYENSLNGLENNRTAYVVYLEDRDFIIGASFNDQKHDELINAYIADSYKIVLYYYLPFLALLMLIVVLIYNYIKQNVEKSVSIFNEEEELYRKFSNLTNEMIVITEATGEILFINTIGERIIGTRENDLHPQNLNQILGEEDGFYVLRGIDKNFFVKFNREQIMYNTEQCELYFITDVTDKVTTEKKLENLVLLDELTNLGNRRKMIKDFNEIINPYVKSNGKEAFLVMLDLDNFKPVNDKYGHLYGDVVLRQIAVFLSEFTTENIMAYRVGGDEFTILIKDLSEKDIFKMFQTLNKKIKRFNWEKNIDISFSGGIASVKAKDKYRRLNDYIEYADKKLYNAKLSGKMKII